MNHKYILTLLTLIALNHQTTTSQNEQTSAERILLELHKECNLDIINTTRNAEKLIASYQIALLESTQNNQAAQQMLTKTKADIEKVFDNIDSNLELYNRMLSLQQEQLQSYKRSRLIQWCITSAITSAVATYLIIKHHQNINFFIAQIKNTI